MILHYGLGFAAGVSSLLAPCVLPLTPIIFGSSLKSSKLGPIATALGLAFSFTLFGVLTSIFSSFFNATVIQKIGSIILILVGLVLIIPNLKAKLVRPLSGVEKKGHELQSMVKGNSLISEFLLGMVLGMVWAPCSGPTLGLAFGLATQSGQLIHASLIFLFFGLGAGIGLVGLGFLLGKFRSLTGAILKHETIFNKITGLVSITLGFVILFDKLGNLEEWILSILPQWMISFATSI